MIMIIIIYRFLDYVVFSVTTKRMVSGRIKL
jgi:hypothetical protein